MEDVFGKYFPGSSTPLDFDVKQAKLEKEVALWDAKPMMFIVRGVPTEFFSIGQLGVALGNRSSNTLRAWEREGILPKSPYVKSSQDPRGRRRMYTRAMVEGIIKIAKEEGVLYPNKGIRLSDTSFTLRAFDLFKELLKETSGRS